MTEIDQFEAILKCVICNDVSNGHHFGVQSCRACAAFFRRTITEKKTYTCRRNSECPINNNEKRNMCRACRYLKCKQAGMNEKGIELDHEPSGSKTISKVKSAVNVKRVYQQCSHDKNYIPIPSTYLTPLSNPVKVPKNYVPEPLTTLKLLKQGCNQYFYGQDDEPFYSHSEQNNNPSFTYLTRATICDLERIHVDRISKITSQYFTPFDKLDNSTKKHVLHQFYAQHSVLEAVYQSYRNASILPKNSWLLFDGYILDETNLSSIIEDTPNQPELVQSVALLVKQTAIIIKSFYKLEIDDMEKAAMSGMLLWQEVASALPTWNETHDAQTTILKELHAYVLQKVGIAKAGSRVGTLMSLTNDVKSASLIFLEREMMEQVFDSRFLDAWESLQL